jgi:hypothetical protein
MYKRARRRDGKEVGGLRRNKRSRKEIGK